MKTITQNIDLSLAPAHRQKETLRQEKMTGEMTITFDHQGMPKVTHLASKNLDIDVDTGRTMVSPP